MARKGPGNRLRYNAASVNSRVCKYLDRVTLLAKDRVRNGKCLLCVTHRKQCHLEITLNEGEGLRSHIHAAWGGKDLFQFMDQTIVKGCPRQEPGVRTDTEIIKEHCFLACIPRFTQFAFLYSLGPPALGMAPPTVDWVLPH